MKDPNDFPLVADMDIIRVGDIFRVENLMVMLDYDPAPLALKVLASFTGHQSRSENGEVQLKVKVLKVYEPADVGLPIELALVGEAIWIVKETAPDNMIRNLVQMIQKAESPTGPQHWS